MAAITNDSFLVTPAKPEPPAFGTYQHTDKTRKVIINVKIISSIVNLFDYLLSFLYNFKDSAVLLLISELLAILYTTILSQVMKPVVKKTNASVNKNSCKFITAPYKN